MLSIDSTHLMAAAKTRLSYGAAATVILFIFFLINKKVVSLHFPRQRKGLIIDYKLII